MIPSNIELQIILLTLAPKHNSFMNLRAVEEFLRAYFNAQAVSRLDESKSVSDRLNFPPELIWAISICQDFL